MQTRELFDRQIEPLESLPYKPNVFWYPSAGKDFRGNVFLTDIHINHEKRYHGREYEKPDLFIFNCLGIGEIEEIKNNIQNGNPLFEDDRTKITGKNLQEFGINKENLGLTINPDFVEITNEKIPEEGKEAFYFELEITGKEDGYRETQKVLYLEHENIDVFEKIILKGYFHVLYLCAICEGCAWGNCKKSIIEHIYKDAFPNFYISQGFKPKYAIVKDIFQNATSDSNYIEVNKYDDYIWETKDRTDPDSTIYKMNYYE